jgi:hypothetical protein
MSILLRKLLHRLQDEHEEGSDLPGNEEATGSRNDERVALLNQIGDQKEGEEFEEFDDQDNLIVPQSAVTDEEEIAPPAKVKIKVNGQEMELTQEELIARAQKVESADAYLAEAARLRREAMEQPKTEASPSVEDAEAKILEERKALARAIQMGTEEEAVEAIARLQATSRAPSFTKDELTRTVDERLSFNEAVSKFRSDYKDIVEDPVLAKMASDRDQELLASGDRRNYLERYSEIGEGIREWVKSIRGTEGEHSETKQERKASVKGVPSAASVRSKPAPSEDDVEETPSEIIAKMAKARGGPQWARG